LAKSDQPGEVWSSLVKGGVTDVFQVRSGDAKWDGRVSEAGWDYTVHGQGQGPGQPSDDSGPALQGQGSAGICLTQEGQPSTFLTPTDSSGIQ